MLARAGTPDEAPITDAEIEALADEAEHGCDADQILRRRRGGRPTLGSAALIVESVPPEPEPKQDLLLRAARDHASVSEVIRRAIGDYLRVS